MQEYYVKQSLDLIQNEYTNWIRWGNDKTVKPQESTSCLDAIILPEKKENHTEVNNMDAIRFEEIVTRLPEDLKRVFVFYALRRSYVKGRLKTYHHYNLKPWKQMGMTKHAYYASLKKAFAHIAKALGYGETNGFKN